MKDHMESEMKNMTSEIRAEMALLENAGGRRNPERKDGKELKQWLLVVDGNGHRPDLVKNVIEFNGRGKILESMIPAIRTVACMIALERVELGLDNESPAVFTDESDWFAARILVLGMRVCHIDVSLFPMLKEANRKAFLFAQKHGLEFEECRGDMSLHANRPENLLIVETELEHPHTDLGLVGNSRFVNERVAFEF